MESLYHRLYAWLFKGEEQAAGKDISEQARQNAPHNYFSLLIAMTLTKIGDELANAKTVLPWLISYLGAANGWVGALVPVRESLSMLPQLAVSGWIMRVHKRKHVWVAGSCMQALALLGMALCTLGLRGNIAAFMIVLLLALFSLGRALCSLSSKDVMAKVVPKSRRGRLNGHAASLAGVCTLIVGGALLWWSGEKSDAVYLALLLSGAGAWVLATGVFASVSEEDSAAPETTAGLWQSLGKLRLLAHEPQLRRYLLSRALLMSSALAGPYYVLLAQQSHSSLSQAQQMGILVVGSGIASAVSSSFWGKLSDRSSRRSLMLAGTIAGLPGALLFCLGSWHHEWLQSLWLACAGFLVVAVAHSGIRVSRKTYMVDMAKADQRTDFVAVSNTVIGLLLLATGFIGLLEPWIGASGILGMLALASFAGVAVSSTLPEVE